MEKSLEYKPIFHLKFEVEKVIGVSTDGSYQVQWAPAWVSRFHLTGCEHLIREFLENQTEREKEIEAGDELSIGSGKSPQVDVDVEELKDGESVKDSNLGERSPPPSLSMEESSSVDNILSNAIDAGIKIEEEEEEEEEMVENNSTFALVPQKEHFNPWRTNYEVYNAESPPISMLMKRTNREHGTNHLMAPHTASERMYKNIQRNQNSIMTLIEKSSDNQGDMARNPLLQLSSSKKDLHKESNISPLQYKGIFTTSPAPSDTSSTMDSSKKPHTCTVCQKQFSNKSHLRDHMRTHTGVKPHQCEHCNKAFAQIGNLHQHQRTHSGEKFLCNMCGKSFSRRYTLDKHVLTHTNNNNNNNNNHNYCRKEFPCDKCGKKFWLEEAYERHILSHVDET